MPCSGFKIVYNMLVNKHGYIQEQTTVIGQKTNFGIRLTRALPHQFEPLVHPPGALTPQWVELT